MDAGPVRDTRTGGRSMTLLSRAHRGMTLIEVLMSLALLSALMLTCVSWTSSMVRSSALHGSQASWNSGAERALDLVDQLLMTEDHQLNSSNRDRWRLVAENGDLLIRSRALVRTNDDAQVCVSAKLLIQGQQLLIEYLDDANQVASTRPLLDELGSVTTELELLEDRTYRLIVRLVHEHGRVCERTWRVAKDDVR